MRFFKSAAAALPHPIDAVKEWWNKPAEYGKAADAMHVLSQLHERAAAMAENKGKPVNQWAHPPVTPEEQAIIEKGMTANLATADDTTGMMGPALLAGGQAQKGDIAGAAGTLVGGYGAPAAAGALADPYVRATAADAVKTGARATAAGVKAAAPDVGVGAAKVAGGYAVARIPVPGVNPLFEAVAGGPIVAGGVKQMGRGLVKGFGALKQSLADTRAATSTRMAGPVAAMPEAATAATTAAQPEPIEPTGQIQKPSSAVPEPPAAGPVSAMPAAFPPPPKGAVPVPETAATPSPVLPTSEGSIALREGPSVAPSADTETGNVTPAANLNPSVKIQPSASAPEAVPAEHPAAEYFRRGLPAPMAAYVKDQTVAGYLKDLGINDDIWEKVSDAQRDKWVRDATKKPRAGQNPERIGDISKMLRADPPEPGTLTPETEAEILRFHQNQTGLGFEAPKNSATLPSDGAAQPSQGTQGPGAGGQGPPVQGAPGPGGGAGPASTSVVIPGGSPDIPVRYAVRELSDIQTSHNGLTFQPNAKYSLVNDRDYTVQDNQAKVINGAQNFNPRLHITDNPDATNGPPIVDSQGNAIGGNGRGMMLQRVYSSNPKAAAAYRAMLEEKAPQFGIDPAAVKAMKQPVLVREVADADLANSQNAITDLNKTGTAALRPVERAIADSRRVSQGTLDHVAAQLDAIGPNATLNQALSGKTGAGILGKLIDDGVITPQERAGLASGDNLTAAGKNRISQLLLGRFFADPAQLERIPAPIVGKLERIAAPLARVESSADWSLTPKIQGALSLIEEAAVRGSRNLTDVVKQSGLFGEQKYTPEIVEFAKKLQRMPAAKLRAAVTQYAQDARFASAGEGLFGGGPTPADSFNQAFGK
jgi:hypothetical protein